MPRGRASLFPLVLTCMHCSIIARRPSTSISQFARFGSCSLGRPRGTYPLRLKNSSSISTVARAAAGQTPMDAEQPSKGESPATADIMDDYEGMVQVIPNTFRDLGGVSRFSGQVETIKCFENNPLVRKRLTGESGTGKVLVVDGGGSMKVALMGDQIAAGAVEKGWEGVIINGAIRDSVEIARLRFGCKALGTMPRKSQKNVPGEEGVPVAFAGLEFRPGQYVYADEDGIVLSNEPLQVPKPADSL